MGCGLVEFPPALAPPERRRLSLSHFLFANHPQTSQHRHHGERTRRPRRPVRTPHHPLIPAVTEPPKRALERQKEILRDPHTTRRDRQKE
jgi:hypothetical protein